MARRVIQFPVRNAFAPRTQDALARDTQEHSHRIVQQVEDELARKAERMNVSTSEELARARSYGVVIMPQTSRIGRLRKRLRALQSSFGAFTAGLFSRPKPQ